MEKEKDHHSFANSVTTDTDGEGGGTKDENEDQAGEGVGDGKVQGAGEERSAEKAEQVNGDGNENGGGGMPAAVHGVAEAVDEVEENGATGKFLGDGQVGQKGGEKKSKKKKEGAERAKPGKGGGQGREGGVGAKAVGRAWKKEKGQTEESGHAKDAIEEDGKSGAGFLLGKPADEIKKANGITPSGADEEQIKEKAHEGEVKSPKVGEMDFLKVEQKVEAGPAHQDGGQSDEEGGAQPQGVGGGESEGEAGPIDLGGQKSDDAPRDGEAEPGRETG